MKGKKINNKANNVKTLQQMPHTLLFLSIIITMIILIAFSAFLKAWENKPSATLHLVKTENGKVISIEEIKNNNIK